MQRGSSDVGAAADARILKELLLHVAVDTPDTWSDGVVDEPVREKDGEKFHDWRVGKDRSKTSHVLLLLCLNVGVDPPDVLRVEPCAKLECWTDPVVAQSKMLTKGSEVIGDLLISQYKQLHKGATYKACLELSVDDLKYHLYSVRKKAKDGRVLLHYNGHGVPKVTQFGELWFFDADHTQYVPVTITDIMQCVGSPAIYVLDCNNAGAVLQYWYTHNFHQSRPRDILICACRRQEDLPLNPALPADLLTACLTTPIKMSLEWYCVYSLRECLLPNVSKEMLDAIPGTVGDRKTPLGELHWIFTAVTDAIAWCSLDRDLFNRLFRPRNDMLQVSLFRNFLLAERIMRDAGCVPVTHPPLPETHHHPLWEVWELSLESVLSQLPKMLNDDLTVNPSYTYKPSSFFADQLTAFEVWVEFGSKSSPTPDQLPCIIQGLSSHQYRVRSLKLLARYLDLGGWAVADALSCGVMPYVVRLLHQADLINYMVVIWTKLLLVDGTETTVAELIKAQAAPAKRDCSDPAAQAEMLKAQMPPAKRFLKVINARLEMLVSSGSGATTAAAAEDAAAAAAAGAAPGCAGCPDAGSVGSSSNLDGVGAGAAHAARAPPPSHPYLEGTALDDCQSMAFFIMCTLMVAWGKEGQVPCWNWGVLSGCLSCLQTPSETRKMFVDTPKGDSDPPPQAAAAAATTTSATASAASSPDSAEEAEVPAMSKSWALMCLAHLVSGIPQAVHYCVVTRELHTAVVAKLLTDPSQVVRTCAVFCLSQFVGLGAEGAFADGAGNGGGAPAGAPAAAAPPSPSSGGSTDGSSTQIHGDVEILRLLATVAEDPSALVREEVLHALLVYFTLYGVSPDADHLRSDQARSGHTGLLDLPDTVSCLNVEMPTTNFSAIKQGDRSSLTASVPVLRSTSSSHSAGGAAGAAGGPPSPVSPQGEAGTGAGAAAGDNSDIRQSLMVDAARLLDLLKDDPFPKLAKTVERETKKAVDAVGGKMAAAAAAAAASSSASAGGAATPAAAATPSPVLPPKSSLFLKMRRRWQKPLLHVGSAVSVLESKKHRELTNKDVMHGYCARIAERCFLPSPSGPPEKVTRDGVSLTPLTASSEPIVSSEFRCFTNQVVLADAANNISVIDALSRRTVNQMQHPSRIASTFLVNDATDSPSILVADKKGTVSVYSRVVATKGSQKVCEQRRQLYFNATRPHTTTDGHEPRNGLRCL